ncbi:MAG: sugar ABC transporter substrate-binding protein [Bauldia litoralis]|uniref:sugar ABC transporter substrate-binding protein n=1 Tax=Bauldia litoralis TaxID=665467 RepID=UPI00329884BD
MTSLKTMAAVLCATALSLGTVLGGAQAQEGTGSVMGEGKELVMFTITASNVYGANQIKGATAEAEKLGYKLTVFQNNFSQPEQDQQVQQYIASGAKPAAVIFWPWVADAAINDVRLLSRLAPVIQLTQEPNEKSWPFVQAYSGANQILIGKTVGEMLIQARDAAKEAGMEFKSPEGNLLIFQHPEGEKTGTERYKGMIEATKDAPFNEIHLEYGANSPESGYEIGSQVIPKFKGEFDFLWVSNQQAANGVIRALKENGITPGKDVYIVSGDCSGSLEAVKNGETFGTGIQPAAVEGALAVRTAAKFVANGGIKGDVIQMEVEAEAPEIDPGPPAKFNFMPHAPATGADGVANTKIWGYNADEICAS